MKCQGENMGRGDVVRSYSTEDISCIPIRMSRIRRYF